MQRNNLVLSVDNYVPKPYNTQYDLKEQAAVADYVFIMAYDEHTDGSNEAGSVASISYLENGVTDALKLVPKEKLVAAILFFYKTLERNSKDGRRVGCRSRNRGSRLSEQCKQSGTWYG